MNAAMPSSRLFFPDPDEPGLEPFMRAFVRMMFAHAEFERRISELLGVITGEPDFGERRENQWSAKRRPKEVRKLYIARRHSIPGDLPEMNDIVKCLCRGVLPSTERNFLVHGTWWQFDTDARSITVRSLTVRVNEEQHRSFSSEEIQKVADLFHDLEVELYQLQKSIEVRLPRDPDVMAALNR